MTTEIKIPSTLTEHQAERIINAVAAESDILDQHLWGWEKDIDPSTLRMDTVTHCLGGQLGWPDIIDRSQRPETDIAFVTSSTRMEDEEIILCQRAWIYEVRRRTGTPNSSKEMASIT